jgi:muramoyltetrapeptide carboxypeptidase
VRRPAPLRAGARIEIVAPSGPVLPAKLDRGAAALRARGYTVSVGQHAVQRNRYLAGTDAQRADDLQRAWLDDDVDAVLCARGGYGALRTVDLLDWDLLSTARPKPFVGSSDATVLHEAFAARLHVVTWFGPMPATDAFGSDDDVDALVAELCRSDTQPLLLNGSTPLSPGRADGRITGGTLTLLAAALGSNEDWPVRDGIVLLEDINEEAYRVDRMLTQLLRAGWFDSVRAVGLGSWLGCPGAEDVIVERLAPRRLPILAGLPFGHGARQRTIPLGADAILDADTGTLTVF